MAQKNYKGNKPLNNEDPKFVAYKSKMKNYVFYEAQSEGEVSDKTILGAYVNIAEDNLAKTMQYIFMKIGINSSANYTETLSNILLANIEEKQRFKTNSSEEIKHKNYLLNAEQNTKLMALLFHHFPVIAPIVGNKKNKDVDDLKKRIASEKISEETILKEARDIVKSANIEDCLTVLLTLVKALHFSRNKHSHYYPYNNIENQKEIYNLWSLTAIYLGHALKASALICEAHAGTYRKQYEFYTGKYHYSTTTDKNKDVKIEEYSDYYYRIKGKRPLIKANGKPYVENKGENPKQYKAISDFGLVYLVSIFLRKADMEQMLDKLKVLSNSPFKNYFPNLFDKESTILKSMISVYRINIPKGDKLKMEDNNVQLCMDMLNELQKCPNELYELLSDKGKNYFRREQMKPVINEKTGEYVRVKFVKSEKGQKNQQTIVESTDGTGNIKYERTGIFSLLVRKEDRFPYFALRYIDNQNIFPTIRFQIDLGYYRFAFYSKHTIDLLPNEDDKIRILQKHINGFGRLVETEHQRLETWAGQFQDFHVAPPRNEDNEESEKDSIELEQLDKSTIDTKPFVTDKRASYNIHNNRIGLIWETNQDSPYVPNLAVEENNDERQKPRPNVRIKSPMASLSVRELPALIFYEYLRSNYKGVGISAEEIIKFTYTLYLKFFKGVANGSIRTLDDVANLKVLQDDISELNWKNPNVQEFAKNLRLDKKDIPTKLLEYLESKSVKSPEERIVGLYEGKAIGEGDKTFFYSGHIQERIDYLEREIEHFEKICLKIATTDNEYGTDDYSAFRPASLARKLAKSIMEWMPANSPAKKKMTGANYSSLVGVLTSIGSQGRNIDYLKYVLEKGLIIPCEETKDLYHPFLSEILTSDVKKTEDLYYSYIVKEREHILKIKNDLSNKSYAEKITIIGAQMPFSHLYRSRYQQRTDEYYKSIAKRYLKIDNSKNGDGVNDYSCILLPDGMFTKYILSVLSKCNLQLEEKACNNASYLISTYFENIMKDESQPFYTSDDDRFLRTYKFFNYWFDPKTKKENYPQKNDRKKKTLPFTKPLSPKDVVAYLKEVDNSKVEEKVKQYVDLEDYKVNQYKIDKEKAEKNLVKVKAKKEKSWYVHSSNKNKDFLVKKEDELIRLSQKIAKLEYMKANAEARKLTYKDKLPRLMKECEKREKIIRRYRIEDIVTFLMVKTFFKAIYKSDNDKANLLKLQTIGSKSFVNGDNSQEAFLDMTIPFSREIPITFKVNDKNELCEKNEKGEKVTIKCEVFLNKIAMRNYNIALTYLKLDERLSSFLSRYAYIWYKKNGNKVFRINYNRLMLEFERYNQLRPDIFGEIHAIERIIVEENLDILNNVNHRYFFVDKDKFDKTDGGTRIDADARRNSFVNLLLLAYDAPTEDSSMMKFIRNAASHNTYNLPFDKLIRKEVLLNLMEAYQKEDTPANKKGTAGVASLKKNDPKSFAQLVYNKIHEIHVNAEKELPVLIKAMKEKNKKSKQ